MKNKNELIVIKIEFKAKPILIRVFRKTLMELVEKYDFSKRDSRKLALAFEEACTNIYKHAYKNDMSKPINLKLFLKNRFIKIELRDKGAPLNPEKLKGRDLSTVKPGGLGIHIIKSYMDEVIFKRTKAYNLLIMSKKLNSERKGEE